MRNLGEEESRRSRGGGGSTLGPCHHVERSLLREVVCGGRG